MSAAAAAESLQSCPALCDPTDGSPPGSSDPGILQARTLEWVAISFSNACVHVSPFKSCPTLCDPMDSSPPGSSVHRSLQARILEWVYMSAVYSIPGQTFCKSSCKDSLNFVCQEGKLLCRSLCHHLKCDHIKLLRKHPNPSTDIKPVRRQI